MEIFGWRGAAARASTAAAIALAITAFAAAASAAPPIDSQHGTGNGHGKPVANNSTGAIEGTFISLLAPSAGNIVEAYTADGVRYLDAVSVGGYGQLNETFANSVVQIDGSTASAEVHDTPGATLKVSLEAGASAAFDAGTGVAVSWGPNGTVALSGGSVDSLAVVWTNCESITIDAGAQGFMVAASHKCNVLVRTHQAATAEESQISNATEAKKVAAEVDVSGDASDAPSITTYADSTVSVDREEQGLRVTVDSPVHTPASVVIRYVRENGSGTPVVDVDGQPAVRASSLEDALDASDDGGVIEYAVVETEDGLVVVISMPVQGAHVVEIHPEVAAITASTPVPIIGAALGFGLAALAAAMLFRRR